LYSARIGACKYIIGRIKETKNEKTSTIIDKAIPQKRCIAPYGSFPLKWVAHGFPEVCVPLLGHGR